MSAFVVDHETINRIVSKVQADKYGRYPLYGRLWKMFGEPETTEELETLGVELLAMNQDAVMQRYPDCDATNLPGPVNPPPYQFKHNPNISNIRVFKAMECLIYQCSEGNIPETELYNTLVDAKNFLACAIVGSLEEYEKYPWG